MQAFDFTEKVAIVTGGGGGIGRAASITLSENGAKVVVVDLSEEAGLLTVNKIKENGGEAKFVKADVTKEDDIKNYVQKTIDSYGKIDIFLNNAGWEGKIMPLIDYPTEVFDQLMSINVRGVFLGLKHVLPHMIEQKSGAVVNTSSGAGLLATPNMVAYGASKHAVLGMTKTAGVEVAPHGVRVNAVCPGVVNTAMMRSIESGFGQGDSAAAETARKQLEATTPDGRYAEPQEIANLMMYLVSDLSSHITGQELVIDGGAILI
ncbi:glucose 1-dehydrogenase [Peribacillus frigoritolerans]|uniref:SDR family NAD(P)-dependent oxidoreductase n=1 Tax=Peribacillus frigoritolerans TaxID=450367 RepID=UPI0021CEE33C|nr:glucose 1-dehydrogenase [Peribacillus frigoritolerans]MCU6599348.1 glucose 1-dehydrogenase [Peribacillus frigoritolerans]